MMHEAQQVSSAHPVEFVASWPSSKSSALETISASVSRFLEYCDYNVLDKSSLTCCAREGDNSQEETAER